MIDINREIVRLIEAGRPFAVGVILSAEGSTPREAGAKAVIEADGTIHGTLGGGAVEAEAQRRAREACRSGCPLILEMELTGEDAAGHQPICGGRVRALLDPTASKDVVAYRAAVQAAEERSRGVLLNSIRAGGETQSVWEPEAELSSWRLPAQLSEAARDCLAAGESRLIQAGAFEVLVEPVVPNPLLLIAGGGHIGQALAVQAQLVGFDVAVIDDRAEFTSPSLFPEGTGLICGDLTQTLPALHIGPDTYIVIVTRGHQHDAEALRACIRTPAAYIGMIGSRRKVALLRESFLEAGWASEAEFDRVRAPIGLDIGAETVPEIAVSIVAQLVAVRRTGASEARPRQAVAP